MNLDPYPEKNPNLSINSLLIKSDPIYAITNGINKQENLENVLTSPKKKPPTVDKASMIRKT